MVILAITMFLLLLGCLNPPPDAAYRDGLLPFFAGFHVLLAVLSGYGLIIVGTGTERPGVKREMGGWFFTNFPACGRLILLRPNRPSAKLSQPYG